MGRIIYIHVPKCGGSSFGAALRMRYLMRGRAITLNQGDPNLTGEARIDSDYTARAQQLRGLVAHGHQLITGHMRYDRALHEGAAQAYSFVTLLRDPVERFVSHYNYLQRKHPNADRPATLEAFLDSRDALRLASQYLYYFGDHHQGRVSDLHEACQQAIANLGQFELVGDLNDPARFARDLGRLSGFAIPLWSRNAAPQPTYVPPGLLSRIETLCAPDIAICTAIRRDKAKAA